MSPRDPDENGWAHSAPAWISRSAEGADFARRHVLDRPMMARVRQAAPRNALDIGCGEGRFCRMMADIGIATTGLDPVAAMIDAAKTAQPDGTFVEGFAEALPFEDASFDLVVSYLSLIDIDDANSAIAEMARVLRPAGRILVANLSSFATSSAIAGRKTCKDTGEEIRPLGRYLQHGKIWFEWDGLRVRNWHRPLSTYLGAFLEHGLTLTCFDEPQPHDCTQTEYAKYQAMPYLMMMEWQNITSG
ncbi:class I SAM-dependent methyltransferase [Yoonia sp. 2307UL14-13]|uniref:class I SAM-dependent methyltransferase n=1 Tax=Yoonia sp. 2307UL14-13 TaxID=3126506 RepID=UPI0030966988